MVTRTLRVLLAGEHIGELVQDQTARMSFRYEVAMPGGSPTPLSLSMPLASAEYSGDVVSAFLWGLLPESPGVLARWGRDFQVSAANPVALLEHVGLDCAGAVQFVRPERADQVLDQGGVEWLDDAGVAQLLRTLHRDSTAWHAGVEDGQFSLAGAQSKIALLHEDGRWGRPWGRTATTHIVKPAIPGLADQDLNEHLCLATARRLGLTAANTDVRAFEDQTAVVVERYDRLRSDQGWIRAHQEDLCQSLGVHPVNKYQSEGGPGPVDIVRLLRSVQTPDRAEESVGGFVDALALNWWLAGTDAHAKNYSVLLSEDQVRLAPLYDISSALPYPDQMNPHKMKLAMKIGREYRLKYISRREWVRLAGDLGLEPDRVLSRVRELGVALPEAMAEVAADPAVRALGSELPGLLVAAVAERVAVQLADLAR
ncbi:MAG: type toxin-antitoxin system HipA family toxin [Actinomycetia bacterium]|nr:type toxin-antitoxin system HipA family toxin [Actinomycetes bacterium]